MGVISPSLERTHQRVKTCHLSCTTIVTRYVHRVLGVRPCAVIPFPIQNQVGMPRRPLCRYSGVVHSPLHFASMPANCSLTSLRFIVFCRRRLICVWTSART